MVITLLIIYMALDLFDLTLFGLGNVVGAGIFVIISKSIKYGGSNTLYALLTVASISILMGFVYIEIYSRHTSSVTEYLAVKETMGENAGTIMLYAVYFFALLSGVTILTGLSKYICNSNLFSIGDTNKHCIETTFIVATLAIVAGISWFGIETSKLVANTISIAMLLILGGIVVLSLPYLNREKIFGLKTSYVPSTNIMLSAVLSLFLYNGYDFLVKISDETENKEDNKTALIATLLITTVIYVFIIMAAVCVLSYGNASNTHNMISDLYSALTNNQLATAVFVAGAFIMFNTGFLSTMSAAKFAQGLGKNKQIFMPEFWSEVNDYGAPKNAIIVTFILGLIFAIFNNDTLMAVFSNFTGVATLILISVALLIMRWRERADKEAQKKHNHIGLNVHNMPILVIINTAVLAGILFKMVKHKFWW